MTAAVAHLNREHGVPFREVHLGTDHSQGAVLHCRFRTHKRWVAGIIVRTRVVRRVNIEAATEVIEGVGDGL